MSKAPRISLSDAFSKVSFLDGELQSILFQVMDKIALVRCLTTVMAASSSRITLEAVNGNAIPAMNWSK